MEESAQIGIDSRSGAFGCRNSREGLSFGRRGFVVMERSLRRWRGGISLLHGRLSLVSSFVDDGSFDGRSGAIEHEQAINAALLLKEGDSLHEELNHLLNEGGLLRCVAVHRLVIIIVIVIPPPLQHGPSVVRQMPLVHQMGAVAVTSAGDPAVQIHSEADLAALP
jgi:hypothetical protein